MHNIYIRKRCTRFQSVAGSQCQKVEVVGDDDAGVIPPGSSGEHLPFPRCPLRIAGSQCQKVEVVGDDDAGVIPPGSSGEHLPFPRCPLRKRYSLLLLGKVYAQHLYKEVVHSFPVSLLVVSARRLKRLVTMMQAFLRVAAETTDPSLATHDGVSYQAVARHLAASAAIGRVVNQRNAVLCAGENYLEGGLFLMLSADWSN
ncbi:hypothetical protein U1Q18_051768 [Sarracenia purpurea var. burkii]